MVSSAADRRLAVLIDAENSSPSNAKLLFEEIAKYGAANVRRAYGDWTKPSLSSWKNVLLEHSVQPVQQYSYTQGKNSSDSALIIDAMDLLHAKNVDAFCIVSSDSDFTRLAARIREDGLSVFGFGEKKTPKPFIQACNAFIYVENLEPAPADQAKSSTKKIGANQQLTVLLTKAVDDALQDDGWAHLGSVGSNLSRLSPDFDSRTYGFPKLKDLVNAHPKFVVESRQLGGAKAPSAYVRPKRTSQVKTKPVTPSA